MIPSQSQQASRRPVFALLIVGLTLAVIIVLLALRQHAAAAALTHYWGTHYWD